MQIPSGWQPCASAGSGELRGELLVSRVVTITGMAYGAFISLLLLLQL